MVLTTLKKLKKESISKKTPEKSFFLQYEKRMQEVFLNPDDRSETNYRKLFYWQVQKLVKSVKEGIPYQSFQIRVRKMAEEFFWVISYDIKDDKRRLKVAMALENYGTRVQ